MAGIVTSYGSDSSAIYILVVNDCRKNNANAGFAIVSKIDRLATEQSNIVKLSKLCCWLHMFCLKAILIESLTQESVFCSVYRQFDRQIN